jgi:ectoine hydroxylase-related dioxygenase (phytanoyl-CoA dioxygenase family)
MERIKWIKFFFYLTDVTEDTGPHVFVPTTQKAFGIPFSLRKKGYVRLSDTEVSEHYPSAIWKEFTGARGTLIVEDTRGLHKGKHCVSGDRLLFQLEFTSSAFGAELKPVQIRPSLNVPQMARALEEFPGVYSMMLRNS